MRRLVAVVLGVVLPLAAGAVPGAARADHGPPERRHAGAPASTRVSESVPVGARPLEGKVIVIDPGHQLGNQHFPEQINRQVPAGGFTKPCNTMGTATDGGYPEATFTWQVSRVLAERLRKQGATVRLTRHSNRQDRWGPCVDVRGRAGNAIGADLKLSIHGDGSYAAGARGFHVIAPADRAPWTDDIFATSQRLARAVKAGLLGRDFVVATYVAGGDGLDVRSDLGTLNLSDVPTVMVELGNMRNPAEARVMTSARGRERYARGLVAGVREFLD
ncbi:N-acetylmuramoyl-L-alanine amidase [Nocardioides exalbidus]|uniref:N-acetylmuramoyl-L-alanine amidase n=1 Tax=Nocardioides exalbidus TaxID=402596 RepID=A0A1H4LDJ8_9ACTN|nr:N-acetylmuramoyl-L-alanine amidase [Nocardioides exalbidus]SEB68831.1 N-acetylmuramoyl-L-alanine amidase [Nocardioides exalbidus]